MDNKYTHGRSIRMDATRRSDPWHRFLAYYRSQHPRVALKNSSTTQCKPGLPIQKKKRLRTTIHVGDPMRTELHHPLCRV